MRDVGADLDIVQSLFPFAFGVDGGAAITWLGSRWAKVSPNLTTGCRFEDVFELVRPVMALDFSALERNGNDIIILRLRDVPALVWRGQVVRGRSSVPTVGTLFVGAPWFTRLEDLSACGLELADFPPHDPRSDLLTLIQTQTLYLEDLRLLTTKLRSTAAALEARSQEMEREMERRATLEAQLRHSGKMEALGRLAGAVAHDYNNILLAIDGYASLALAALPGEAPAAPSLQSIRAAAARATTLTRQLLGFTRQAPFQPKALDIARELEDLRPLLTPLAQGKRTIEIDAPGDVGLAWADRAAFKQMVMNIALNAFDAMAHGGTLSIRVGVAAESPGTKLAPHGYLEIALSDTGHGMDEAIRSRVFEPFFTTKAPGTGSGLGLSTVHGLVEQCGGSITCTSTVGVGTTFRILLPRIEATESVGQNTAPQPAGPSDGAKILFVEDDPLVRHLVTQLLVGSGFNVTTTTGPGEALALLRAGLSVDVVVTDVVMPEMSGTELVRAAEDLRGPLRTVFISGHTHDPLFRSGELAPFYRFLRKPFPPFELIREVKAVLGVAAPLSPGELSRRG